tara:strand:+ start:445 stop:5793 length:5349 start_codon:yes stop_codon:yes gene_type:complete
MAGSPIFRRITLTEVKKTSNKRGSLLKELARLENEEQDIIKNHHDPSYSNWRASFLIEDGMDTSGFMQTTLSGQGDTNLETIEGNVEASYQAYEGGSDALSNTAITSSGTGSGSTGGFDLGKDYLGFNGNSTPRYAALKPIDATKFDTIVITGVRGNDSNGGEDPDETNEDLMVYYQLPGENTIHRLDYSGGVQQSGVEYKIIPVGSGDGTLKDWTLALPSYARAENIRFILYQPTHHGTGFDNYGVTQINYRRTSPLTVFVSLDSPEASAFIRVGSPSKASQSKKQREKQLREQLEASKDYTDKKFGENFPGSTTPAPGEEDPTEQEKRAPGIGEFEPEVVDYNTWKQETEEENPQAKTSEKEYEKWKDDKRLKSFAAIRAARDAQGEPEPSEPTATDDKKSFDNFKDDSTPKRGMQLNKLLPKGDDDQENDKQQLDLIKNVEKGIEDSLKNPSQAKIGVLKPSGVSNPLMYNATLAGSLATSMVTGMPGQIPISPQGAADMASAMNADELANVITIGQSTPMDAENTLNPVNKTDQVLKNSLWGIQGGSTFNFNPDTGMLEIVSNKAIRTTSGGESVTRDADGRIISFTDIPEPEPADVEKIVRRLAQNPVVDKILNVMSTFSDKVTGQSASYENPITYGMTAPVTNSWELMKNSIDQTDYENFIGLITSIVEPLGSIAGDTVQGVASNAYALRQALLDMGFPKSDIEEMGGALGQVGSKAEIPLDKLKEVNPKAYEELIKKAEGEGYILKGGKLEKDTEITGEAGDQLWADDPNMEKNPDTGVWQEIDWDERLKNLPSWFSTYGPAEVVELENGVKGIFGYNYSGGSTFITATSDRGPRGSSESGYGTQGYDTATNTGGTLWLGLNTGTGPDDPRGLDAYVASKNPAGPPKPELDRETGDPGTRKPPEVPRDEITSAKPPEGWPTDSDAYVDFEIQQKTGGAVDSVDPAAYPGGYEARYNNDPEFAARMDALDADIEKFSGEEAAARKELRNLTIKFGWDVATTIFGGFVIGGAVRAVQGITAMNRLAKAAQLAKTLRATQGLSKAEAASKANLIINQAMKIPITKNMAASGLSTKLDDAANALWSSMHKSTDPATKAAANALVKAMETGSDDAVNAVMKAIEKDVYGYGQSVLKSAASVVDDIVIKGANSFDDVVANMDNLQTSMNKTYQALLKTNKQVAGEYGSVGRDMLQMLRQLRANPNDATTLRNFNSALKRMGEIAAGAGITMGGAIAGELGVEEELASQLTDEQKKDLEAQLTKAYEDDPEFAKFIDGEIDNYFDSAAVKDADNEIKTLNDEIKEAKKEARAERGDEISAAYNAYTDLRDQQKEISKEKYNAYRETQSWYKYPEYVKAEEKWQRLSKDLAPVGQNVTTDKAQLAKWQNAAKEYPAAEKAFIKASKDAQAKAKKAKEAFFAEQGPRDIKDKEESDKLYKIYKDLSTNVNWKEIEDKYAGEKVKEIQTKIDNVRSGQMDKLNALFIKLLDQVGLYDIENLIAPEGYGDPDSDEYFEFDLFSSPEQAGGMDPNTGVDMAASPNSPDPVKPGDVPTAPSSPYLPGKSPYNISSNVPRGDSTPIDPKTGVPYPYGPTQLPGGNPQAKRIVPQKDFGSVADLYGGQGVDASTLASVASQTQKGRGVKPKKKRLSRTRVTSSYKPKGSLIIEKKQLKSPNQFFNQDDIKPDYPKDPPPEMVNNYHPNLVDGEKVSQRFNKLDPASAKAMPKTGNPHIDAKVEKAKNNPDKDGPAWHKKVSDKIRKARAQQRTGTGQSNGDDSNGDGGEG